MGRETDRRHILVKSQCFAQFGIKSAACRVMFPQQSLETKRCENIRCACLSRPIFFLFPNSRLIRLTWPCQWILSFVTCCFFLREKYFLFQLGAVSCCSSCKIHWNKLKKYISKLKSCAAHVGVAHGHTTIWHKILSSALVTTST